MVGSGRFVFFSRCFSERGRWGQAGQPRGENRSCVLSALQQRAYTCPPTHETPHVHLFVYLRPPPPVSPSNTVLYVHSTYVGIHSLSRVNPLLTFADAAAAAALVSFGQEEKTPVEEQSDVAPLANIIITTALTPPIAGTLKAIAYTYPLSPLQDHI